MKPELEHRETISLEVSDVEPTVESVLDAQGIPSAVAASDRIVELAEQAISLFHVLAAPIGVWAPISRSAFDRVLCGEGRNAPTTPIEGTVSGADDLALFAVTVGEELMTAIMDLFDRREPALASMLDACASEGAESAAERLEQRFVDWLAAKGRFSPGSGALRYSPGYCGWHVSGQRELFDYLLPEEIGITLRDSFLMQPMKSVSGVIIVGRREIFDFDNAFDFCDECTTRTCRERIGAMLGGANHAET